MNPNPDLSKGPGASDAWRVFRIMAEFVEGFESLANIGPAVTIFGSAPANPKIRFIRPPRPLADCSQKKTLPSSPAVDPGLWKLPTKDASKPVA